MRLERVDIVKALIENEPNSMNQVARINEDLYNYKVRPTSTQGKTLDKFTRQLVKNVDNFNAVDKNGDNAVHIAVQHGD